MPLTARHRWLLLELRLIYFLLRLLYRFPAYRKRVFRMKLSGGFEYELGELVTIGGRTGARYLGRGKYLLL